MNGAVNLHGMGQCLWLDNITRAMLDDGTLARYRRELAITGLTSNPTIFQHALASTTSYDAAIAAGAAGQSSEALFFSLALDDLRRAADLLRPDFDASAGADGWCRWKFRRCWSMTRRPRSGSPPNCMSRPRGLTCSSKFRVRRPAWRRSRSRFLPAYRSMSRCCFRAHSTWPQPKRICAALNGASQPVSLRLWHRRRPCSAAAGTWRWPKGDRARYATGLASR